MVAFCVRILSENCLFETLLIHCILYVAFPSLGFNEIWNSILKAVFEDLRMSYRLLVVSTFVLTNLYDTENSLSDV